VRLNAQSLLDDLDSISNETIEWKRRLKDCEFIELIYEEYVQDQPGWNAKALEFLGAPWYALSSDLRKVNPDELGSLVSNFDEIASIVRKSRYSSCLPAES
jgi:GTP:adenosylcobinamide-phosphate guanylyltransferase